MTYATSSREKEQARKRQEKRRRNLERLEAWADEVAEIAAEAGLELPPRPAVRGPRKKRRVMMD